MYLRRKTDMVGHLTLTKNKGMAVAMPLHSNETLTYSFFSSPPSAGAASPCA